MRETRAILTLVILALSYACSDDAVLEPSEPESCTNSTCNPMYIFYPTVFLDVSNDGDPDLKIRHVGMGVCITEASDCSGYSWRIVEQIDSLYFAYDEMTERVCAFSLGDTIDTRFQYVQGGTRTSEQLPIAEIYQEGDWDSFWSGAFVNPGIRYLGFKLIESGEEYYGWIGLNVSEYDGSVYLSTKCYKSAEGSAVIAGKCP